MWRWFMVCLLSVLLLSALGPTVGLQSAAVSPWPCFRQSPQHQGVSSFAGPQTATEKWSLQTNGEVWANAVVGADGTIYIGSADTNLYALTPEGSLLWSLALGSINGAVALAPDGTIYVGADKLYAVNPAGTKKWEFVTNAGVAAAPVVAENGTIYAGAFVIATTQPSFFAVSASGTLIWEQSIGPITGSPAIGSDGTIYVASWLKKLYAFRPTGDLLWTFDLGGLGGSPTLGPDGTIYVSGGSTLHAILPSGSEAWHFSVALAVGDAAFAPGGTIFFGSSTGALYALSAATGAEQWNLSVGSMISGSSPIVDADGVIYVGTEGGKFLAVRPDGTLKWEFGIGSDTYSPGTLDASGALYFGANNGKIYALGVGKPSGPIVLPTFTTTFMKPIHPYFPVPVSFPDVPSDYWAYQEIMGLAEKSVINGYPDGNFKPEFPVTRAEFAKMVVLALGLPTQVQIPQITFSDVPPQHWAFTFVEIAAKNNLVKGYPDGTFQPEGRITMAEILAVIMRTKEYRLLPPPGPPPYILVEEPDGTLRDLTEEDWFYNTVWLAAENGVLLFPDNPHISTPGIDAGHYQFRFNSPATRAQTAVFLTRMPK